MRLNRIFGGIALSSVAALTLAGCGKEKADVTLTVWGPSAQQEVLKTLGQQFAEKKTEETGKVYEVKVGLVEETKITETLSNDLKNSADVFAYANDAVNRLARLKALSAVPTSMVADLKATHSEAAIEAATDGSGAVLGYPLSGDNGYFMYYDKSVFTKPEDVESFERMFEVAGAAGKKVSFNMDDSWYLAGFFFATGGTYEVTYNDENVETSATCNFNEEGGMATAKALINIAENPAYQDYKDDADLVSNIGGKFAAVISGTWNAKAVQEKLGENYAACKLPTFTVDGKTYQTGSFAGYKLMGVNSTSKNLADAHELAQFLTSAEAQAYRYEKTLVGPTVKSVIESDAVKADVALSALLAQNEYAVAQESVPSMFWESVKPFGADVLNKVITSSTSEADLQARLDKMVGLIEGTVKPAE